jgi:bla regulator protein blaR1
MIILTSALSPASLLIALAAPVANHLWQSTLFAGVAALLAFILRENHAKTRYWLWLIASAKFAIPFSLLISAGSHLAPVKASEGTQPALVFVVQQISQPFLAPNSSLAEPRAASTLLPLLIRPLPAVISILWFSGFAATLSLWFLRWRRMTAPLRNPSQVNSGRELEALRRLQQNASATAKIKIILSDSVLEPGIVGIFRPVLLLPAGISDHLTDAQLDAIIVHELCHVRRRDNLAAALHMFIEALFWFHPMLWWIGARLVDERELACDQEVLILGSEPQVYAEGILKICKLYLESPLFCAAGVTGSNLKKRIEAIMAYRPARNLHSGKKLLLALMATMAIVGPFGFGLLHATQRRAGSQVEDTLKIASPAAHSRALLSPSGCALTRDWQAAAGGEQAFEIASVKQNNSGNEYSSMNVSLFPGDDYPLNDGVFLGTNVPLISYIYFAHKLNGNQLQLLLPQISKSWWVRTDKFDIQAHVQGAPTKDEVRLMVQSLLADRFKLAIHCETRQLPAFALVLADSGKTGPLLRPHPDDSSCPAASTPKNPANPGSEHSPATVAGQFPAVCGSMVSMPSGTPGRMRVGARNVPIGLLANTLAQLGNLDRAVLDQTGLNGNFDFALEWNTSANAQAGESGPKFLGDLKSQLGLRLVSQTGPVDVFVLDHVERLALGDTGSAP